MMKNETVKIKSINNVTHDVLRIVTEKPSGADFKPGQATEIFIDKQGWQNEGRPYTFTCLPQQDFLEFTIKTYPEGKAVSNELLTLKAGDTLIVNDIFGAIEFKGDGTFIAGGAGVTPFIAIFRDLSKKKKLGTNKLIFANKKQEDIILKDEFKEMLGENFLNILSKEKIDEYAYGHITEEFLKKNSGPSGSYYYLCGPPPMMDAVEEQLKNLKIPADKIVKEEF